MQFPSRISVWFSLVAFLALAAMARAPLERLESVVLETQEGQRHTFSVELAENQEERARGLMFREHLDRDAGMLFLFPRQRRLSFWMKDTPLPLDIIFIDRDGVIVHIAENTTPFSLKPIPSHFPAVGALEVNAGVSTDLNIKIGDVVRHPFFRNMPDTEGPAS